MRAAGERLCSGRTHIKREVAAVDEAAKKTALRMIPYGLYVLTAQGRDGAVAAATVNWVTQASFAPPLVAVGVKVDSGAHPIIKRRGCSR